jgi:hypothetical protein
MAMDKWLEDQLCDEAALDEDDEEFYAELFTGEIAEPELESTPLSEVFPNFTGDHYHE